MMNNRPHHVAIILDGNGRWAKQRGLPRTMGHQKGATNLQKIVETAHQEGVHVLSVFAFSTENWQRPQAEVDFLMHLPKSREKEIYDALDKPPLPVRVVFSGRRDRLNAYNQKMMQDIEEKTAHQDAFILNICMDYGAQDELVQSAKQMAREVRAGRLDPEAIDATLLSSYLYTKDLPPVDLLIRTSGEQRLSNFLLWQSAYAELYFTKTPWPAFGPKKFIQALDQYAGRERRFGTVGEDSE